MADSVLKRGRTPILFALLGLTAKNRSAASSTDQQHQQGDRRGRQLREGAHANWDSDDEEWKRGLDEDLDAALLAVPRKLHYRDEDLERIILDLESKARTMQYHVRSTINTMEQEACSRIPDGSEDDGGESDNGAASDAAASEALFIDAETTEISKALVRTSASTND